jgi:hypothetical protein
MDALDSPRRWSVVWRTAALHAWLVGLGFGLPCVYAIWYFADQGLVWTFMGFPTYGEGPFEDVGLVTTLPLLMVFLLVCLAELPLLISLRAITASSSSTRRNIMYRKDKAMPTMLASGGDQTPAEDRQLTA